MDNFMVLGIWMYNSRYLLVESQFTMWRDDVADFHMSFGLDDSSTYGHVEYLIV